MPTITVPLLLTMRDIPDEVDNPTAIIDAAVKRLNELLTEHGTGDDNHDTPYFANADLRPMDDGHYFPDDSWAPAPPPDASEQ